MTKEKVDRFVFIQKSLLFNYCLFCRGYAFVFSTWKNSVSSELAVCVIISNAYLGQWLTSYFYLKANILLLMSNLLTLAYLLICLKVKRLSQTGVWERKHYQPRLSQSLYSIFIQKSLLFELSSIRQARAYTYWYKEDVKAFSELSERKNK